MVARWVHRPQEDLLRLARRTMRPPPTQCLAAAPYPYGRATGPATRSWHPQAVSQRSAAVLFSGANAHNRAQHCVLLLHCASSRANIYSAFAQPQILPGLYLRHAKNYSGHEPLQ